MLQKRPSPTLPANFYGCTDEFASNYDANARVAAATCTYPPPCWEYTEAEWIDATGGERHEIADDAHVRVDLPFTFTWYSASFDFVKIASNGFLTFGDGDLPEDGSHVGGAHTRTAPAPDAGPPNNAAFVWWTDLDPSVHGGDGLHALEPNAICGRVELASGTFATAGCCWLLLDARCTSHP